jgi:hypothetical protein
MQLSQQHKLHRLAVAMAALPQQVQERQQLLPACLTLLLLMR